jgi:tetratricopeptide (TPR) repeat protein
MPRRKSSTSEFEELRSAGIATASKLVIEHKYEMAKDVFMKLLNLSPDDVEVMTLHANIFFLEGKILEAERGFDQVLTLNPDYPLALYLLGAVYHEKGEYERAIHMYETALKHFPEKNKKDIADTYQNLGCSLWEIKRREEAIEAWNTCLKYNPRQKYARENLKDFANEYGMPSVPMFDDYYAFTDLKDKEYLARKDKEDFDDIKEASLVLHKSMDAWNDKILPKWVQN